MWMFGLLCCNVNIHVTCFKVLQVISFCPLQVEIANKYAAYHGEQFGYSKPNTDFKLGEMEHLADVGIQDNSMDIIM